MATIKRSIFASILALGGRAMGSALIGLVAVLVPLQGAMAQVPALNSGNQRPTAASTTRGDAQEQNGLLRKDFAGMPLLFIENQGQLDSSVAYYLQGQDVSLYFTPGGVTYLFQQWTQRGEKAGAAPDPYAVRLEFVGADATVRPVGGQPHDTIVSYFHGQPAEWHTGLLTYARIVYRELWPGIDLVYYGKEGALKYEFMVKPGADPAQIRLAYRGVLDLAIDEQGQLVVETPAGRFADATPYAYQRTQGSERPITVAYALSGDDSFGYQIGAYDRSKPLVLDPVVLLWGGNLGTRTAGERGYTPSDAITGVAVDQNRSAYIIGYTATWPGNTLFPLAVGPVLSRCTDCYEHFVAKVKPDGSGFDYIGFLGTTPVLGRGGFWGSNVEELKEAIVVDAAGNAYVAGHTGSAPRFPVRGGLDSTFNGGAYDAFVAKVSADGRELVYAGFLGGADNDAATGIAVDDEGNAYVTGWTNSNQNTFPVLVGPDLSYNGGTDAFVAKIAADGSGLVYSGYIGGAGSDIAHAAALDGVGHLYVTGRTASDEASFPVRGGPALAYAGGSADAFVAKVNPAGTGLVYAGYVGGNKFDVASDIAVDELGNAYITGITLSDANSFPLITGPKAQKSFNGEIFVTKIDPEHAIRYSGYAGFASGDDSGAAIAVDSAGSAYVAHYYGVSRIRADGSDFAFIAQYRVGSGQWMHYPYEMAVDNQWNMYIVGEGSPCHEQGWYNWTEPECGAWADGYLEKYAYIPDMQVSRTQLSFNAVEGGINPSAQSFILWDDSEADQMRWSASADVPWISLSYPSPTAVPVSITAGVDIGRLAPGIYTGTVTVTGLDPSGQTKTVQVTLTIGDGASPLLDVAPAQLYFAANTGGAATPAVGEFVVRNLGAGSLTWNATVTAGAEWLQLVAAPAGTADGAGTVVPVRLVNIGGLAPGLYLGEITVASPGAAGSPQTIQVALEIIPPPTLMTSPRQNLLFNALYENGPPSPQFITIFNGGGGGPQPWSAAVRELDGTGWLRLDKTSGNTLDRIAVSVATESLVLGRTYHGRIEIASPGVQGSPRVIDVTLSYGTNLSFKVNPGSLTFYMVHNQAAPAVQTLTIARSAGVLRSYNWQAEVTSQQEWLAVDGTAGDAMTDVPLQVQAAPGTLPIGRYMGQILFRSDVAQGTPRTVPVTFVIAEREAAPQCLQSDQLLINQLTGSLKLEGTRTTPNTDGSCTIAATLVIDLPQMPPLRVAVQGTIDAQNRLNALVDANNDVTLDVASLKLKLKNITLTNAGLEADANWLLGGLSSASPGAGKVRIDRSGLTFAGQQEFVFSPVQSISVDGFAIQIAKIALKVDTGSDSYALDLHGSIAIGVGGGPSATAKAVVTLNRSGVRNTKISSFGLKGVGGLDLAIENAELTGGKLFAAQASFKAPAEWGGFATTLTGVSITSRGALSIGGGSFKLPAIKAGDGFSLTSLEGSFQKENNQYIIAANGIFKLPLGEGSGSCKLDVGVKFRADGRGGSMMEISSAAVAPADESGATRLVLDQFGVGVWDCPISAAIPIGSTGFYLTGVRGTITLSGGIESVLIEVQVRSALSLGGKPAIGAEASALIKTRPPSLDFTGTVAVAGMRAAETRVYISKANGLTATFIFDYEIYHADLTVDVWRRNGRTYITGNGNANVVLEAGKFGEGCVQLWKKYCARIPPSDWASPTVEAAFGTFTNNTFGVKGSIEYDFSLKGVELFSFRGGFFVDDNGRLAVGNVDRYVLATRPQVTALRAIYAARARGEVVTAAAELDGQVAFAPNGDVLIAVPARTGARAGTASQPYTVTQQTDFIFVVAQPVTGTLTFELVTPTGGSITPQSLPAMAAYQEDVSGDQRQSLYAVGQATPGVWQMRIGGDTDNVDYVAMAIGNVPPPLFTATAAPIAGNPDQVNLLYAVQSTAQAAAVSVYANPGPLSRTVAITDSAGVVTSEVVAVFMGMPIATALPTTLDGSLHEQPIDLSVLPTGVYHLWAEADDGRNPPVRKQLITVAIDRLASFPGSAAAFAVTRDVENVTWQTTLATVQDIAAGDLLIEWTRNLHPDVDAYRVRLRSTDPLSPTEEIVEEYSAGDVASTTIGGIAPGKTYQIAVGAEDVESSRIAWSQETTVITEQPEFLIDLGGSLAAAVSADPAHARRPDAIAIRAGEQLTVPIALELADNLPDPVALVIDYDQMPLDFNVLLGQEVVVANGDVGVGITVAREQAVGHYPVHLVARSGSFVRNLVLTVEVLPASPQPGAENPVFLPLITK